MHLYVFILLVFGVEPIYALYVSIHIYISLSLSLYIVFSAEPMQALNVSVYIYISISTQLVVRTEPM